MRVEALKTFLLRLVQCLWYLFATAIVLTAVLVTVARLSTPLLNQHRSDFEAWASKVLEVPISIAEVHADWRGYIPEFTLSQVVIYDAKSHQPAFEIEEIKIGFQLISSVWERKIVLQDMIISGAHVTVLQDEKGELTIKDLPTQQNHQGFNPLELSEVVGWIFSQPYLSLRDIDVDYVAFKGQTKILDFEKITIWNNALHHKVSANFVLEQEVPTKVQARIELTGEAKDLDHLKAKAYFKVEGFSLPQWIKTKGQFSIFSNQILSGWQIHRGLGGADIWVNWENHEVKELQSIFQWYDLEFYSDYDQKTYPIQRLSGHVGWKREGEKQIIAGDNLLIDFPEHLWPATTFYVGLKSREAKHWVLEELRMGYINIQDLLPIILANASIPQDLRKNILDLSPQGNLADLSFHWQGELTELAGLSMSGTVDKFSLHPWRNFPGIKNLKASYKWANSAGSLQVDSKALSITLHSLFADPLYFDKLSGYVGILRDNEGSWSFSAMDAMANNAEINSKAMIQMVFPMKGSPFIDLRAVFSLASATQVTHYLPTMILEHSLVDWLKAAFLSGHVVNGKVAVRGALKDFPFDEPPAALLQAQKPLPKTTAVINEKPKQAPTEKGLFEISAEFADLDFHYAPEWPIVQKAKGQLVFAGRSMRVWVDTASIFGVPLKGIVGTIPYLGEMKPQLLSIEGKIQTDLARAASFIQESPLHKVIGRNMSEMELEGPIELALNLSVPLAKPEDTKVLGIVALSQGKLSLADWKFELEQVDGSFRFTENSLTADKLQGSLYGEPTLLSFSTIPAKAGRPSFIQALLSGRVSVASLQAMLDMDLSRFITGATHYQATVKLYQTAKMNNELIFSSNLQGIAIDLTPPFGKTAALKRDFSLGLSLAGSSQVLAQLKYGDLVAANLNVISGDDYRQVDIDSQQLKGRLRIAYPFSIKRPLSAQFERMVLSSSNEQTISSLNPQTLPPLVITARQLVYASRNLGQLTLNTVPMSNGMLIQNFNLSMPDCNFKSHGQWTGVSHAQRTQLQGSMESANVRRFLDQMGWHLGALIVDKGKANFDLQWKGPPYNFSLANAGGVFSFALERGRIINLNESSNNKMDVGRMLSLFSLQTIPRRLSLDFSDLFEQGYSFDFIRADFSLKQGNAYIRKEAIFEGPVAQVTASGRIGLLTQDYDLRLSVSPYVTDSLPVVAGALTLNPLVGAAAWVVNKMILSKEVSKAVTYTYSVTGPWASPVWQSAKGNSRVKS